MIYMLIVFVNIRRLTRIIQIITLPGLGGGEALRTGHYSVTDNGPF